MKKSKVKSPIGAVLADIESKATPKDRATIQKMYNRLNFYIQVLTTNPMHSLYNNLTQELYNFIMKSGCEESVKTHMRCYAKTRFRVLFKELNIQKK